MRLGTWNCTRNQNRAEIPIKTLADVVHAFPTRGEVLEAALRALAR